MRSKHMFWRYLNWSEKTVSKIGSNAFKIILILIKNVLKNNKAMFDLCACFIRLERQVATLVNGTREIVQKNDENTNNGMIYKSRY